MIKVAVRSCKLNTSLEPCCLFDGVENDLTEWLRREGVQVYFHTSSLFKQLEQHCLQTYGIDSGHLQVASSAFMRIDIPELVTNDEFALYTDCDVVFLQDPLTDIAMPRLLACAPQINRGDYQDMNSGVILMHLPSLRAELLRFRAFIVQTLNIKIDYDQAAYRYFYGGRYDLLPDELNWKPYWGKNPNARIIHFHGPKPHIITRLSENDCFDTYPVYRCFFNKNRDGYAYYLNVWNTFRS